MQYKRVCKICNIIEINGKRRQFCIECGKMRRSIQRRKSNKKYYSSKNPPKQKKIIIYISYDGEYKKIFHKLKLLGIEM